MKINNIINLVEKELRKVRNIIYHRIYINSNLEKKLIDEFHKLYYEFPEKTWNNTFWLGIPTQKCPLDLWIYQEIIYDVKPDVIVEAGTANGGGALFLAGICDFVGNGRVISIDIANADKKPKHKRIDYLLGSSTSEEIVRKVKGSIKEHDKVMVILDSDHSKSHVLDELRIYNKLVTKGSYLVVEDTNINNHPVSSNFGPGPMEAVEVFLQENHDFVIDKRKEKFYLTFNPKGYLRKMR